MALLTSFPSFLLGKISFLEWANRFNTMYGLGTHWSASVIYSGLFIGISKHLHDKLEIENSLNLSITTGVVGLAIGTFEFYWIGSFFLFQNQPWILSFKFPQLRILLQNALFILVGLVMVSGINYESFKLKLNWKTLILVVITIGFAVLWWNYGVLFPVQQISVPIENGTVWTSSPCFPQTMYTIQTDPNVAAGDLFHVENPAVHLVNNLTKIFWTLSFYSLFSIEERIRERT
jgi:hypothetical protein